MAQVGFVPLSLRDVKLEKSDVAWSDIGGMCFLRILTTLSCDAMSKPLVRVIRNAENATRDFGVADEVWSNFQTISPPATFWVRL